MVCTTFVTPQFLRARRLCKGEVAICLLHDGHWSVGTNTTVSDEPRLEGVAYTRYQLRIISSSGAYFVIQGTYRRLFSSLLT